MKNSLLFRPIPYKDETPASILIRAATENGHASVYQLLSGSGIKLNEPCLRATFIDQPRYELIVKRLGLSDDAAALSLSRMDSARRSPRRYRSMSIPDRCFRRDDARAFCAACLAEFPYWRQQWLVRPFSACIRHKRLLLDLCGVCNSVPSIGRSELASCNRCRASLLGMHGPTVNVDAMLAVECMFASNSSDDLSDVLSFWEALTSFDGLDDSPATEHARLEASVSFSKGKVGALVHVAARVVQRLPLVGPRIQLLPFLSGSPAHPSSTVERVSY